MWPSRFPVTTTSRTVTSSSIAPASADRRKTFCLPGTYYINPQLFKVIPESAKEVKPGEVAVIVSNTGKDPSEEIRRKMAAKVRERMEREEKEQAEETVARLDKLDDKRTAEEIKNEL